MSCDLSALSLVFPCCCFGAIGVTFLAEGLSQHPVCCSPQKTNRGAARFQMGVTLSHMLIVCFLCVCERETGRERWWVVRWLVPGMFHDVLPSREGPRPGRLRLTARPCCSFLPLSLSQSLTSLLILLCWKIFLAAFPENRFTAASYKLRYCAS